jgi:hypothetical protein
MLSTQFGMLEQSFLAWAQRRTEEAAELAITSTDGFYGWAGIEDDFPLFWVPAIEFALAAGRLDDANRLLHQVADSPDGLTPPYLRAQLHRMTALVRLAEGDDTSAEKDLALAIDGLRAYGAPFYIARAQLELAELLQRQGRGAEAVAHSEAAHTAFDALGAKPWSERAAALSSLATV